MKVLILPSALWIEINVFFPKCKCILHPSVVELLMYRCITYKLWKKKELNWVFMFKCAFFVCFQCVIRDRSRFSLAYQCLWLEQLVSFDHTFCSTYLLIYNAYSDQPHIHPIVRSNQAVHFDSVYCDIQCFHILNDVNSKMWINITMFERWNARAYLVNMAVYSIKIDWSSFGYQTTLKYPHKK